MNCVMIKMGGQGVRFGTTLPKQFYEIDGMPLFAYVLKRYNSIDSIDKFIIVTNPEWYGLTKRYAESILGEKLLEIVNGGDTNAKSTYNGVMSAAQYLNKKDILLVHDVTDPIVINKSINDAINTCKEHECVAVITEQVHTLYKKDVNGYIIGTIEKKSVGSGYSPEAFVFEVIYNAFKDSSEIELNNMTSAMALVQAHGYRPFSIISHQLDIKITYQEDMESLKYLIRKGESLFQK